ncbi:MAG: hypothetical protein AAFN12_06105 [Cyanobacteria bacterium J06560_2]
MMSLHHNRAAVKPSPEDPTTVDSEPSISYKNHRYKTMCAAIASLNMLATLLLANRSHPYLCRAQHPPTLLI